MSSRRVWLVPVYTTEPAKAATSFDILIQPYQNSKFSDLAKGSGGEFRYVVPRADRKLSSKIVEVALVRSDRPVKATPSGWDGYSVIDILNGRARGFLHLVWKTASTNSWYVVRLPLISNVSSYRMKVICVVDIDKPVQVQWDSNPVYQSPQGKSLLLLHVPKLNSS